LHKRPDAPASGRFRPVARGDSHTKKSCILLSACAALASYAVCPMAVPAQNQFEMNRQADRAFIAADARMNRVYKRLMGRLDYESQAKLKRSQRAWATFRGGSMAPMINSGTRAEETKTRTRELEQTLKDEVQ